MSTWQLLVSHNVVTMMQVMASTIPTPRSPEAARRVAAMQERFKALAQQQEQLVEMVDEMLGDTTTSSSGRGRGGGDRMSATLTLGGEDKKDQKADMEATRNLLDLLEGDDSVRYGPETDFTRDAAREEEFLLTTESVPAPRLVELHDVVLNLRRDMEAEVMPDILGRFEEKVPEEEIVVAKIAVEEIQKKEKMIEEVGSDIRAALPSSYNTNHALLVLV